MSEFIRSSLSSRTLAVTESVQTHDHLAQKGFAMLEGVFAIPEIETLGIRLDTAFLVEDEPSTLRSRGRTYGSRNLLQTFPDVIELLNTPRLQSFTARVLGAGAGIVRVLYFDKPPDRSWSLPWHKDRTIAVRRNDLPSRHFYKPTVKAGVPHVEAPPWLLQNMLTLRVHLDAMTEENGPLHVIPGSHLDEEVQSPELPLELHANAGDVLAMRPLLSHSSTVSKPGTSMHRRVIHIEFAADEDLPDGYEWHSFIRLK